MINIGKVVVGSPTNIKKIEVGEPTQTSITSGLKNKITSLPVPNGGTGNTVFAVNGVLIGNGQNPIFTVRSTEEGLLLTIDANGAPTFSTISCGTF